MSLIKLEGISKSYQVAGQRYSVLNQLSLRVSEGECLAIVGASGSGKSTLMNIIGLLDRPDEGIYELNHKNLLTESDDSLARLRNQYLGFVFQSFFLLPRMNVLQNVALPLVYRGTEKTEREALALSVLEKVGLRDYALRKPNQLSGGQQQRVAIARALVGKPSLLLADEPTGALDKRTSQEIMELFLSLNEEEQMTFIVITHEDAVARQCRCVMRMEEGVLHENVV